MASACTVEERGGKWVTVSDGKVTGTYDTEAEAQAAKNKGKESGEREGYDPAKRYETLAEAITDQPKGFILGPMVPEAGGRAGSRWAVCVIREGLSLNRTLYPAETLRRATPLSNKAKVFWNHSDGSHMRDPQAIAGWISDPEYAAREGVGAIGAILHATSSKLREMLLEAHEAGNPDLLGLSHTAQAETERIKLADGPAYRVKEIKAIESVDVVSFPSAGGRVMRLVAGLTSPVAVTEEDLMQFADKVKKLQEARPDLASKLSATPTEAEVDALLIEALTPAKVEAPPPAPVVAPKTEPVKEAVGGGITDDERQMLREAIVSNTLNGRTLPEPIKESLKASLLARADLSAAVAKAEVDRWVAAASRVQEGYVASAGRGIDVTKDEADKLLAECEGFSMAGASDSVVKAFEAEHGRKPAKLSIRSFRRLYETITGDTNITGQLTESIKLGRFTRLLEQVQQTSFPALWLDSQRKRMVAEYRGIDAQYTQWRDIVSTIRPVRDFGLQTVSNFGSLGDLAIVNELAPYVPFANPTDGSETYTPQKRGRILQISREAILRDDVGLIQRFPREIGRAAARTLNRFVFSRLTNNALMADGVALFAAAITRGYTVAGNTILTALSEANITEARLRLQRCPDRDGNNQLGLSPELLVVPPELGPLAWRLTQMPMVAVAGQNATEPSMVREFYGLRRVLVCPELTDVNNYYIIANPQDIETIEVSFINGQEEPELFLQNEPTSGAMFTNDAITYKPRHEYGAVPIDWRGMIAGLVP